VSIFTYEEVNKIGNEIKFQLNNSSLPEAFQNKEDNLLVIEVSNVANNFFECKLI